LTKITLKQWDEIIVHEHIKTELSNLIEKRTQFLRTGQIAEPLFWAEGLVFSIAPLTPSNDVIKEQMNGIVHYSAVEFAAMPKFKKSIVESTITIPIFDMTPYPALKDLANELKKQYNIK
jgi:hypothetical protein